MRRAILLLTVVLLGTVDLSAEDGADLQGARVRVKTTGSIRLVGVVADADADALMI
jgi:hypothetical protein